MSGAVLDGDFVVLTTARMPSKVYVRLISDLHGQSWLYLPVVRCWDCKYYTPECASREEREYGVYEDVWEPGCCFNPERRPHGRDESGGWHVVGIDTPPDGFCAWGERREVVE